MIIRWLINCRVSTCIQKDDGQAKEKEIGKPYGRLPHTSGLRQATTFRSSKVVFVPTSGEHIPRQPCRHGSYRTLVMVYAHRLSSSCQFPAWSSRLHFVLLHSSRCSSLPLPLFSGLLCARRLRPKSR